MTVPLKELDGARSTEIEHKDGVVYFDGGTARHCFAFDAALLMRAIERELGVTIVRDVFKTVRSGAVTLNMN